MYIRCNLNSFDLAAKFSIYYKLFDYMFLLGRIMIRCFLKATPEQDSFAFRPMCLTQKATPWAASSSPIEFIYPGHGPDPPLYLGREYQLDCSRSRGRLCMGESIAASKPKGKRSRDGRTPEWMALRNSVVSVAIVQCLTGDNYP